MEAEENDSTMRIQAILRGGETRKTTRSELRKTESVSDMMARGGTEAVSRYLSESPEDVSRVESELSRLKLLGTPRTSRLAKQIKEISDLKAAAASMSLKDIPQNSAEALMEQGGPAAVAAYIEQNPNSARRLQDELKHVSLVARPSL